MQSLALTLTVLIGLVHLYIFVLESFLWERARRVFGVRRDQPGAELVRTLLKNMGTYNAFLAAGLLWSAMHPDALVQRQLALFFLACVLVAGVVGAATASRRILFIQAVPAALALTAWLVA